MIAAIARRLRAARRAMTARREDGAVTIEFLFLFLPLMALVFFIFQIALAYHYMLSAQKGVIMGARIAAVREAVHQAVPAVNTVAPGARVGDSCSAGACAAPPQNEWICLGRADVSAVGASRAGDGFTPGSGADCDDAVFREIYAEINRLAFGVDPEDVTLIYSNSNIGFAGGPYRPLVTVYVPERPLPFTFLGVLRAGGLTGLTEDPVLTGVASTRITEDLRSEN